MAIRSESNAIILPEDEHALDGIYRRYRHAVRRYVARNFGLGPPDPEDVVQAAFEKYAQVADPARIENPYAFLVRSCRNVVIDQRRRLAVRADYAADIGATDNEFDDLDAERVLSSRERWEILARTIQTLDERQREMLLMNRVDGFSCAEIARQRGCSASLVKLLVAEALATCRDALDKAEGV